MCVSVCVCVRNCFKAHTAPPLLHTRNIELTNQYLSHDKHLKHALDKASDLQVSTLSLSPDTAAHSLSSTHPHPRT